MHTRCRHSTIRKHYGHGSVIRHHHPQTLWTWFWHMAATSANIMRLRHTAAPSANIKNMVSSYDTTIRKHYEVSSVNSPVNSPVLLTAAHRYCRLLPTGKHIGTVDCCPHAHRYCRVLSTGKLTGTGACCPQINSPVYYRKSTLQKM